MLKRRSSVSNCCRIESSNRLNSIFIKFNFFIFQKYFCKGGRAPGALPPRSATVAYTLSPKALWINSVVPIHNLHILKIFLHDPLDQADNKSLRSTDRSKYCLEHFQTTRFMRPLPKQIADGKTGIYRYIVEKCGEL